MRAGMIILWIFIICLMAENSQQGRRIRKLEREVTSCRTDITDLQSDLQDAFNALNNIRTSAPGITVFDNIEGD